MADGNENIIFTGFISGDTLASVYSNAYAVCLPSDIEGMSLSLLEAMSYGNAVICSDIPENTAVCGDAALTFKKGDVADLKEKLNLLLENKEKTEHLRGIAAGHVLSRFRGTKRLTRHVNFTIYPERRKRHMQNLNIDGIQSEFLEHLSSFLSADDLAAFEKSFTLLNVQDNIFIFEYSDKAAYKDFVSRNINALRIVAGGICAKMPDIRFKYKNRTGQVTKDAGCGRKAFCRA